MSSITRQYFKYYLCCAAGLLISLLPSLRFPTIWLFGYFLFFLFREKRQEALGFKREKCWEISTKCFTCVVYLLLLRQTTFYLKALMFFSWKTFKLRGKSVYYLTCLFKNVVAFIIGTSLCKSVKALYNHDAYDVSDIWLTLSKCFVNFFSNGGKLKSIYWGHQLLPQATTALN